MNRPRHYSPAELKKFGVTVVEEQKVILNCDKCGQGWSPNIQPGGKMPRGYWKCPNGCNDLDRDSGS
jgi:hypothetical protein